jgi:hypothetical protein
MDKLSAAEAATKAFSPPMARMLADELPLYPRRNAGGSHILNDISDRVSQVI